MSAIALWTEDTSPRKMWRYCPLRHLTSVGRRNVRFAISRLGLTLDSVTTFSGTSWVIGGSRTSMPRTAFSVSASGPNCPTMARWCSPQQTPPSDFPYPHAPGLAQKAIRRRICYASRMPLRVCTVSFKSPSGVSHGVEVEAESFVKRRESASLVSKGWRD